MKGARHIHIRRIEMAGQPGTKTAVATVVMMDGLEPEAQRRRLG